MKKLALILTLLTCPLHPNTGAATTAAAASVGGEPDVVEFITPAALAGVAQQHPVATLTQTEPAATTAPAAALDKTAVAIVALVGTIAARPEYKGRHPYTTADSIADAFKKEWANYNEETFEANGNTVVEVVMTQPTMPHAVRCALYVLFPNKLGELGHAFKMNPIDYGRETNAFVTTAEVRSLANDNYEAQLKKNNQETQALSRHITECTNNHDTRILPELAGIIAHYCQEPMRWGMSLAEAYAYKKARANASELYRSTVDDGHFPAMAISDPAGLAEQFIAHLDLFGNFIALRPQAFQCQLRQLSLRFNCLTEIPEYTFSNQPNLESLDISDNYITQLAPASFAGLRYLTNLDASGNKLGSLTIETLREMPGLQKLDLTSNPLRELPTQSMLEQLVFLTIVVMPMGGINEDKDAAYTTYRATRLLFKNRTRPNLDFETWKKRDIEEQAKLAHATAATTAAATTAAKPQ